MNWVGSVGCFENEIKRRAKSKRATDMFFMGRTGLVDQTGLSLVEIEAKSATYVS